MLPSISGRARPSVGIAGIVPILFGYGLLVTIESSKHSNLHMQKKENLLLARKLERLLTP